MSRIMAGTAEVDIEMPVGMDLTGYVARTSCSAGVHDALKIRCILFENGAIRFALAVCDLLGLSSKVVQDISRIVEERTAIPAANISVACIHTHSGPASIHLQDCGDVDSRWLSRLKISIVECIVMASQNIKPCRLSYKTGECGININRVVDSADEALCLRDTQVSVLEIRDDTSGEVDALLVNYACHPVVLTHDNLLYSRDYSYFLAEALQRTYRYKANIVFSSSCCGDLDPRERGSFDIAERLGEELAESILKIEESSISEEGINSGLISINTLSVSIPLNYNFDEHYLLAEIEKYSRELKETEQSDANSITIKVLNAHKHWAEKMLEMLKAGILTRMVEADIKLIRIGSLVIVTLPFEAFHEIGLKIKEHYGCLNTMVICYANGDYGYMPSEQMYPRCGYEVKEAYKYYGFPGPIAEGAENIIFNRLFKE